MEGILFDKQRELDAVIVSNKGFIPNLPDGSAVEVPAFVDKKGIVPMQMEPCRKRLRP